MRERVKNDLGTPESFLAYVRRFDRIALDPCSNAWSLVRATIALSLDDGRDGLCESWTYLMRKVKGIVFVNPPYGHADPEPGSDKKHGGPLLLPWSQKIRDEGKAGAEIISLVPHDQSTEWWRVLRTSCTARVDLDKRLAFEGGKHGAGQIRNAVFYHGPRPYLFAHHFAELGEVHLYAHRRAA
jgi:hypothetical protein